MKEKQPFSFMIETFFDQAWFCSHYISVYFLSQDLFASVAKSKPKADQDKASTPQPTKAVSSSLFSDDEVCEDEKVKNRIKRHVQYNPLIL